MTAARSSTALCLLAVTLACGESDASPIEGSTEGAATGSDTAAPASSETGGTIGVDADGTAATEDTGEPPPAEPHPTFDGLADNTAVNLGAFMCDGPDDVCANVTDFSGMAYDSAAHRMLIFGGGHSTTMTDTVFAFDLRAELTWSQLYQPTPCESMDPSNLDEALGAWISGADGPYPRPVSAHTYDFVAFDPGSRELVLLGRMFTGGYCSGAGNDIEGPVAHFSFETDAWSFSDDPTSAELQSDISAGEYDPVAKQFVTLGASGLRAYDPATRTMTAWVEQLSAPEGGPANIPELTFANELIYYPPTDTFYYIIRGALMQTLALHIDRDDIAASTLEVIPTTGQTSDHPEPGYDYDPVNQIIGGGFIDGRFYAFDPADAAWTEHEMLGDTADSVAFHTVAYDPLNNVFVYVSESAETFAYRYRAG